MRDSQEEGSPLRPHPRLPCREWISVSGMRDSTSHVLPRRARSHPGRSRIAIWRRCPFSATAFNFDESGARGRAMPPAREGPGRRSLGPFSDDDVRRRSDAGDVLDAFVAQREEVDAAEEVLPAAQDIGAMASSSSMSRACRY